ncbi:MAG TPA: hypothetical protein VFM40_02415 [Actinomycetota bacterium]|nr:hypothetical protein [Actinomycetota bacterium]
MRRLLPLVAILAIAGAACSASDEPVRPSSATTAPTTAQGTRATPSPVPTAEPPSPEPTPVEDPDVRLPEGTPAVVDGAGELALIASGDLTPLVPSGASPTSRIALGDPIEQIVLTWSDGGPVRRRNGLIVWQRSEDESWHAVYAFTDPARLGVFGIRVDEGELTGDAIPDVLSFEDVGGSGACGTYRVIAIAAGDASELFRRDTCDTQIAIVGGYLRIREAVFRAGDPHCCPSAFRESTLRWNGTSWEEVSSEVVPNDPAGR